MEDAPENDISKKNMKKTEIKVRKRWHSLPLKSFKVTSPAESKIISIICDNIFEDVNIEQNNNLSMLNIGLKIFLKNILNDNFDKIKGNTINNEKDKKSIIISKTLAPKETNNDNILGEEDDDLIINRGHKNSYIFNNLLKLKMIKCPRLLEDQWKYEKILLDYNIIDFTSKNNIILYNIKIFIYLYSDSRNVYDFNKIRR